VRVEGDGVHEIPVGPVHAGIIEPGHFRFSVVGEKVLRLEERLGYVHKGIDKRFEAFSVAEGHRLAGRVSGDSTVAYAWAYAQAAESLARTTPPSRALWLRALMLERERVANHLGDLGALGNDAALAFALSQFMRLKEDWLRMNGELFGHRLLMDRIVPGGVAADLDGSQAQRIVGQTRTLESELAELHDIFDEHAGLQDRFITTGRVTPDLAARLGLAGLAGRSSGQAFDLRADFPAQPYDTLAVRKVVHGAGDVATRVKVRFEELTESLRLIRAILAQAPAGPIAVPLAEARAGALGCGWVEGWRGEVLVALEAGESGAIRRCHAHDPSWQGWPLLEHAVIGNIVPDFPLINKSFNLSYSGADC
jgi:Ni,Fe-hydrogenase III large subunit